MVQRIFPAAALTALLVLAGCAGVVPGDGTPTAGATPSPTVTTGESLAGIEFPRGFSRTAIDRAVVEDRTLRFLRAEPVDLVALERFRPGAYADYEYEANGSRARFRFDVHNGYSDVTERDIYVDPRAWYGRQARDDRLSFRTANASITETRQRAAASVWAVLARILMFAEFRAVRADRVDGDRRIQYAVTGVVFENATDVRGRLVVDGDGVVREAQLRYTRSDEPKRFEYVLRSRSGVTVSPPAWLPAARTGR